MKIQRITLKNFLGARDVDLRINRPVVLVAGSNGAGKSSIQEGVRMAFLGEPCRVSLKKEYGQLVSEGAQNGHAEVDIGTAIPFITLPDGNHVQPSEFNIPAELPYVLDAQRFASLDHSGRRGFLFGLMGLSAGGAAVKQRMLDRGCKPDLVEIILPMLRAGFDAAHKDAQTKARDEKTAWRVVTGETYGEKKAETWAAPAGASVDEATIIQAEQEADLAHSALGEAQQYLGTVTAQFNAIQQGADKLRGLQETADKLERVQAKLEIDEAELVALQAVIEENKVIAAGGRKEGLLHALAYSLNDSLAMLIPFGDMTEDQRKQLADANVAMDRYFKEHGELSYSTASNEAVAEASAKLPQLEKSLGMLERAIANDKRDLEASQNARTTLESMQPEQGAHADQSAVEAAKQAVAAAREKAQQASQHLANLRAEATKAAEAGKRTDKAMQHHKSVIAWGLIADALSPDGIPAEMLAEALGPINGRLGTSATLSEWPQVAISADMDITYGGRAYALCSESEKWRADAMIAEAVAHLSGLKLLVLDRFDVLDPFGREDCLYWLEAIAEAGELETALVFGTLKAVPRLEGFKQLEGHWVENGVAGYGRDERAAA